jgi:uncharacterized protein (DUF2141 family)
MSLNKILVFLRKFSVMLGIIIAYYSCASVQRPQGGPRDRTPPKLLKATPLNQTKNFTANTIQLDFDEYFKLNNQYQEINISPSLEKLPEFNIKSKSLVIKLKDTLQKNTTYVINFGKAIADVNEGNVLKNFTYVFSTGPIIDSLNVSGTVTNTETLVKEKDVTVMLIPLKQDSLIFGRKKPSIYTTTDTSGSFKLSNLHEGDYKIYALKETNGNRIYDNDEELVAFSKKVIHLKRDSANIKLNLFKQLPAKFRVNERRIDPDGKLFFTFNKRIYKPGVRIAEPLINEQKLVEFSKTADTATIFSKNMAFDSIHVSFLSNNVPLDTIIIRKGKRETYKRKIDLRYNLSEDKLKPGTDLVAVTNYPIENIDASLITMTEDSIGVSNYTVQRDTGNLKRFIVKYRWRQGHQYEIAFNEGTFTDIYGDRNARYIKKFTQDKPENYGTLTLKVTVPDTGHYIVQLTTPDYKIIRNDEITKTGLIVYRNFGTAKYRVRVVYDDNANGAWDTGNIKQKKYPENIWLSAKDIVLRPNWDAEEAVDIPKEKINP